MKGGWPLLPEELYCENGQRNKDIYSLKKELFLLGDLLKEPAVPDDIFDERTVNALKRFQLRNCLNTSDLPDFITLSALRIPVEERIRQLKMNMERWRWLPHLTEETYLLVNIADFSLSVRKNEKEVLSKKIIAGKPDLETPEFYARMQYVDINPTWDVPKYIAVKEILPILKKNPAYLDKNHMKVFYKGLQLNPYGINWNTVSEKDFPYDIKQVPGSWNALDQIAFMFPNPFNVYLHGTPYKNLFREEVRSFSHGCMRVEKPLDLATLLLNYDPLWTQENIEQYIAKKKEKIVPLKIKPLVYVTYLTAWVDEKGTLQFRNDIYGHDRILAAVLNSKQNFNMP